MPRLHRTLGLVFVLALAGRAGATPPVEAETRLSFFAYGRTFVLETTGSSLPAQFVGSVESLGPSVADQAVADDWVMFSYADDIGKVRSLTRTTIPLQPRPPPGDVKQDYQALLHWKKTFRRGSGAGHARYSIVPSFIEVANPMVALGGGPFAQMGIVISLSSPAVSGGIALSAYLSVTDEATAGCTLRTTDPLALYTCESGFTPARGFTSDESPLPSAVTSSKGYVYLQTEPLSGDIDLTGIPTNTEYTISYELFTRVLMIGAENSAIARIGDPLDPESGIVLDVLDPPADDPLPAPSCTVVPDPERFVFAADGTVTDQRTGLTWQRCPLGQALSTGSNADDPTDDRCTPSRGGAATWQEALSGAAADASAGHDDWRLPNVKELESIAELGCQAPAILPGPFPETPPSPFWSSTPSREPTRAMTVDFLQGDLLALPKLDRAFVRLVRGAGTPLPARPALSVGRPEPVVEASGLALSFPVVLDHPAASDVTFRYRSRDETATEGADYAAALGTATIPAGATSTSVLVTVLDDALGEGNETFALDLDQVSAAARLLQPTASGDILDDEPRVTVTGGQVYEGPYDLAFTVELSKAAAADVTVDFATSDGTATAGLDYLATAGSVTIPAGALAAQVTVPVLSDAVAEADETVVLTLTHASPNVLIDGAAATGLVVESRPTLLALNDTGVSACSNASITSGSCPQPGFPKQDAEVGRDVLFPSNADGPLGFVWTKLDANGTPLPDQSVPFGSGAWSCIRDEVTGLVWEVKTDAGDLRDKDWTYSWYDPSGVGTGGDPGAAGGGDCGATVSCDTQAFVAAVNTAGLCGKQDWRLPTREELFSIVVGESFDRTWFPNTGTFFSTWTSTTVAGHVGSAWEISPGSGTPLPRGKSIPNTVRLVRVGP